MAKAVFTTKVDPTYDDLPEFHYHFPKRYLSVAETTVGDWIVYYEPRRTSGEEASRGGRQSYFATARVTSITQDPAREGHFYAYISDYLEFDHAVPFREGKYYYESALQHDDGQTNLGAFRRSVRSIPYEQYERILRAGFSTILVDKHKAVEELNEVGEEEPLVVDRPLMQRMVTRPFRDAAFSRQVKEAYSHRCALTGIQIRNGGGRSEAEAAHIRPVDDHGPDSVRNGIALSRTIHWMFDRGLISLDDDYSILIANKRIPNAISSMFNSNGRLRLPTTSVQVPHRQFVRYHRKSIFLG